MENKIKTSISRQLGPVFWIAITAFIYICIWNHNLTEKEFISNPVQKNKKRQSQFEPRLLTEISNFLREHKEVGKPIATQSIPNWESGKRQRVTFNTGRNLLFYTKNGRVTSIWEDASYPDPYNLARKKIWP